MDRFGKFPGTVPSLFCLTYLQAHHLDLGFYDHHFGPGAYLCGRTPSTGSAGTPDLEGSLPLTEAITDLK